jgi:virginiamycin B lyase
VSGFPAKRIAAAVVALALALVSAPAAVAAPKVDSPVFPVPGFAVNNKLVAGPDGNMWATLDGIAKDVARITPAGAVTEYDLGVESPLGIAAGPDGNLWITFEHGVARFSTADPVGSVKLQADADIVTPSSIVTGPDGNMWVATSDRVVHFAPVDPTSFEKVEVPGLTSHDIDVAGSLLVIADSGQNRIVTLTTAGTKVDFPIAGASQGVAGAPGGQIAFSAPLAEPEQIGLITPPNPAQPFELLKDPFGVALGADGAFWVVQSAANGVSRVTPAGGITFFGGFPTASQPRQIAPGPGNTLWVGMEGSEGVPAAVGRISGVEAPGTTPPVARAPETRITRFPNRTVTTTGRRAKVKFAFSSSSAGARFECALRKLRKGKAQAKPRFKACGSPKVYLLAPGSYAFSVRAVKAGVVDASPATRSFRVRHRH